MQQEFDGPTEHVYKTVSALLLAAIPSVSSNSHSKQKFD